jgi:HYR domain/HYDIN/CFA65/VesB-like, Ig-like domain
MSGILYGNLRIEVFAVVGDRVERAALRLPPPLLRLRHTLSRVEAPPVLLARGEQLDEVGRAIRAQGSIEFNASCGFGKSTVLRQVAANAVGDGIGGMCVFLRVGDADVQDLLQRLVDELYTTDQPVKLTPEQCTQLLGQIQAVILLDDVLLRPGQLEQLVRVLPGCSLVLAGPRPVLGRLGSSRNLAGLPDDAALELVTRDLERPITSRELPAATRLVAAVDGQPLHLRQAAALARQDGLSFETLAKKAAHDPEVLDRLSIDALAEHERRALAVLALAAGAMLPKELVQAMGDIAQIGECLGLLHRRGLADEQDDRFGLPVCKAESYRQMLLKDLHLAAAVRELGNWLTTQDPTSEESRSAVGAALAVIGFAAERGDWPTVVRLVRVAEPILMLAGRWEACRHALDLGLQGATAIGDRAAEALFSHQQGTLALCQDRLDAAQRLLEHALDLREQLGDHDGAAVTRHNLQLLQPPPPPPPPRRRPRRLSRLAIVGAGVLAILVLIVVRGLAQTPGGPKHDGSAELDPTVLRFGKQQVNTTSAAHNLTIRNTGATQLRVTAVEIGGENRGDFQMTANGCPAPIDPGRRCSLGVSFRPTALGGRNATLALRLTGTTTPLQVSLDGSGVRAPDGPAPDQHAPTLKVRDLTAEATSKDGATVRYVVTAVDDVDGQVPAACRPTSGSRFPLGTTRISCAASDRSGNTASDGFTITVRDTKPPTVTVPGDVTVEATGPDGATAEYPQPTASDRVDGPVPVHCQPPSGGTFPLGGTKITCSAVDAHGNTSKASFAIIIRDTTPPKIDTHEDVTVSVGSQANSATVTFDTPTANDTVDTDVTVTCQPSSGSDFPLGTTTVTCIATDDSGNHSASQFTVTVNAPPIVS